MTTERWGTESRYLTDFWPCPADASEVALRTLARCPRITEWGFSVAGRLWWKLDERIDRTEWQCLHLCIKRVLSRAISTHAVIEWTETEPK